MVDAPKYTSLATSPVTVEKLLDVLETYVFQVEVEGLTPGCDVSSAQSGATALTVGLIQCLFGIDGEQAFQLAYDRGERAIRKAHAAK